MPRCLPAAMVLLTAVITQAQASVVSSETFVSSTMYYDQARERLVFCLPSREIWEWDGQHWAKSSATLPVAITQVIYDSSRQLAFLAGAGGAFYSFDGHSVVDRGPAPTPIGRMVADTLRGRILTFSSSGTTALNYEWDGTTWQPGPALPSQSILLGAAFDPILGVTVASTLSLLVPITFQTLHGDGTSWTVQSQGGQSHGSLVFDAVRQQVLSVASSTWAWDGSNWTFLPTAQTPGASGFGSDPAHGRLWLYNSTTVYEHRVWSWDGTDWSPTLDTPHPRVTIIPGFTFDSARGRTMLYPGDSVHREWDGLNWHDIAVASTPPERTQHSQVFDAARGETIVFGGIQSTATMLNDTWAWNGTSWRLAASTGPSPRSRAAIAFDSGRSRVVLVGGALPPIGAAADHWEWDGVSWTQIATTTPIGQVLSAMAYDPIRARTVLLDNLGRTWELNGTTWNQVATTGPTSIAVYSLAWNAAKQRVTGNLQASQNVFQRYEWDGVQWTQQFPSSGVLAFDSVRDAMISYTGDVLRTESTHIAGVTNYGTPCGGTNVATSLTAFGLPRPGDAAFHLDLRAEATQRPALIGFSLAGANMPIGYGCTMLLQNSLGSVLWFTNANGCWSYQFALPNDLALRGLPFVAQGGVLDPNSPGNLALSQGLSIVIGD
jgi:hypothetical protein